MSLAKQIENLVDPKPSLFNPDEEELEDVTRAQLVEQDESFDVGTANSRSSIRKKLGVNLAEDDRYKGKVIRRHNISSDVEELSEEDDDQDVESYSDNYDEADDMSDIDNTRVLNRDSKQVHEMQYNYGTENKETVDDMQTFARFDLEEEKGKAAAVQAQLKLWEKLLSARIKMQRILALANRLPQTTDSWSQFLNQTSKAVDKQQTVDLKSDLATCQKAITSTLNLTLKLQDSLWASNEATKYLLNYADSNAVDQEPHDSDEEILSSPDEDEEDEQNKEASKKQMHQMRSLKFTDYDPFLDKRHGNFRRYRNKILLHWYEKTKLASGKIGSKNDFSSFDRNILQQIEQVMADEKRLLRRTQLKRHEYSILGKRKAALETTEGSKEIEDADDELDEEIFDDDDFYHQLLREVIERKTVGITDPHALGRQWLEVQKLRSKVKKKLVDRKASKARKIRYDVLPKLVNFTAPLDLAKDFYDTRQELLKSLFSKVAA